MHIKIFKMVNESRNDPSSYLLGPGTYKIEAYDEFEHSEESYEIEIKEGNSFRLAGIRNRVVMLVTDPE